MARVLRLLLGIAVIQAIITESISLSEISGSGGFNCAAQASIAT